MTKNSITYEIDLLVFREVKIYNFYLFFFFGEYREYVSRVLQAVRLGKQRVEKLIMKSIQLTYPYVHRVNFFFIINPHHIVTFLILLRCFVPSSYHHKQTRVYHMSDDGTWNIRSGMCHSADWWSSSKWFHLWYGTK